MSNLEYPSAVEPAPEAAGLSEWQRVTNTFTAPSKTFEDIKRGHRSWWLPFLITVLIGYVFFAAVTFKVGWAQVAENAIHLNPKSEEKLNQAPPAQKEMAMKWTQYGMEIGFAAAPVFVLIGVALASLVLWGTINLGFGGRASFSNIFVVSIFAGLPGIIKMILGTIVIFVVNTPESFNLNNFAPTSLGAFMNPLETNAALYKLATALDVTSIWGIVLTGIGIATVAGVKRSSGYIAVFGWWALFVSITVGWAAAFS
jgi:hypothetical protein